MKPHWSGSVRIEKCRKDRSVHYIDGYKLRKCLVVAFTFVRRCSWYLEPLWVFKENPSNVAIRALFRTDIHLRCSVQWVTRQDRWCGKTDADWPRELRIVMIILTRILSQNSYSGFSRPWIVMGFPGPQNTYGTPKVDMNPDSGYRGTNPNRDGRIFRWEDSY